MIFVSFVSIFAKSLESWRAYAAVGQRFAMLCASVCFLAGIGAAVLLDLCVHRIGHGQHHHHNHHHRQHEHVSDDVESALPLTEPAAEDEELHTETVQLVPDAEQLVPDAEESEGQKRKALVRMGTLITVAMIIHNIPEGMATYAGTIADARSGAGLAVAVALHNIPAGVSIAMPFAFASGSCWKGVLIAAVVGVCEPLGALIAYAFLTSVDTSLAFGIVFGFVSGMLMHISIHESLPTAKRCDEKIATHGFIAGLAIMALSLSLFDVL
jgi:ZIP family zinc transporter